MNWRVEWKAISVRIKGLLEAGKFFVQASVKNSSDSYGVVKNQLNPQSLEIYEDLKIFFNSYQRVLPPQAEGCLKCFLSKNTEKFSDKATLHEHAFHYRVAVLVSFCSEFEYHTTDRTAIVARQSERAFCHLQRTIVADETAREKWLKAFANGEVACEKLGAVHLLSHGIWCFKVDGAGERTDLVWQTPLIETDEVESVADALVLTEWKIARSNNEVAQKIAEAMNQVRRYSKGVLAGVELTNYKYIVIVTEHVYNMAPDETFDGAIYRCINLAVNPKTPSKGAKRIQ